MKTVNDTSRSDGSGTEPLLGFLTADAVVSLPGGLTKEEVLKFMIETLAGQGRVSSDLVPLLAAALQERERLGTTGLARGLALPHLRCREVKEFTGLVGVSAEGVDFDSLDGRPTRVVVLVVSPFDERQRHTEILGRLARLFSDKTLPYTTQIHRSPDALLEYLGARPAKGSSDE